MARAFITGRARAISRTDFNTRVKRLVADMPDPRKATRYLKPSTRLPFRRPVK